MDSSSVLVHQISSSFSFSFSTGIGVRVGVTMCEPLCTTANEEPDPENRNGFSWYDSLVPSWYKSLCPALFNQFTLPCSRVFQGSPLGEVVQVVRLSILSSTSQDSNRENECGGEECTTNKYRDEKQVTREILATEGAKTVFLEIVSEREVICHLGLPAFWCKVSSIFFSLHSTLSHRHAIAHAMVWAVCSCLTVVAAPSIGAGTMFPWYGREEMEGEMR